MLDAAGVSGDGYTFHSWRHTMRSRLADAGADIQTAKLLLGHTDGGCITDVYTFDAVADETVRRASAAVEALG